MSPAAKIAVVVTIMLVGMLVGAYVAIPRLCKPISSATVYCHIIGWVGAIVGCVIIVAVAIMAYDQWLWVQGHKKQ